jgi:hypothetical protein
VKGNIGQFAVGKGAAPGEDNEGVVPVASRRGKGQGQSEFSRLLGAAGKPGPRATKVAAGTPASASAPAPHSAEIVDAAEPPAYDWPGAAQATAPHEAPATAVRPAPAVAPDAGARTGHGRQDALAMLATAADVTPGRSTAGGARAAGAGRAGLAATLDRAAHAAPLVPPAAAPAQVAGPGDEPAAAGRSGARPPKLHAGVAPALPHAAASGTGTHDSLARGPSGLPRPAAGERERAPAPRLGQPPPAAAHGRTAAQAPVAHPASGQAPAALAPAVAAAPGAGEIVDEGARLTTERVVAPTDRAAVRTSSQLAPGTALVSQTGVSPGARAAALRSAVSQSAASASADPQRAVPQSVASASAELQPAAPQPALPQSALPQSAASESGTPPQPALRPVRAAGARPPGAAPQAGPAVKDGLAPKAATGGDGHAVIASGQDDRLLDGAAASGAHGLAAPMVARAPAPGTEAAPFGPPAGVPGLTVPASPAPATGVPLAHSPPRPPRLPSPPRPRAGEAPAADVAAGATPDEAAATQPMPPAARSAAQALRLAARPPGAATTEPTAEPPAVRAGQSAPQLTAAAERPQPEGGRQLRPDREGDAAAGDERDRRTAHAAAALVHSFAHAAAHVAPPPQPAPGLVDAGLATVARDHARPLRVERALGAAAAPAPADDDRDRDSASGSRRLEAPAPAAAAAPAPEAPPLPAPAPPAFTDGTAAFAAAPAPALPPAAAPLADHAAADPGLQVAVMQHAAHVSIAGEDGRALELHVRLLPDGADIRASGPMAPMVQARVNELTMALASQGLTLGNLELGHRDNGDTPDRDGAEAREQADGVHGARRAPRAAGASNGSGATNVAGRIHVKA